MTVGDVYEAIGANAAGKMSDADLKQLENVACPGQAHAVGSLQPIPWRWRWSFLAFRRWALTSVPATDPRKNEVAKRLRPAHHGPPTAWSHAP